MWIILLVALCLLMAYKCTADASAKEAAKQKKKNQPFSISYYRRHNLDQD